MTDYKHRITRREATAAMASAVLGSTLTGYGHGLAQGAEAKKADATVDARAFALTQETPPKLDGDPKLMQFDVEKLPEGLVDLQIDARQVYQFANLTNKDGKLRALVLPKSNGEVKIYELSPKTEVRLQIFMGKAEKQFLATGEKYANFKYSENPNYVRAIAVDIEKNAATKGAKNTHAIQFYTGDGVTGNLIGHFDESVKTVLPELKDYKLSWDSHVEEQLKATPAKGK